MRKSETHDTVMACRLLWREPACQNAWESSLAASRGDRPKIILDGCLPSYCSDAAGICGWDRTQMDLESETPDWFEGWAELNRKVLPVDLEGQVEAPEAGEFAKRLLFLVTLQR